MSSLFKGLASALSPGTSFPTTPAGQSSADLIRFGQVLDVVLDDTSEYYSSDIGIGVIRFRLIPDDITKAENDIGTFAFPLDKTNYRVPLPGEQVLIYTIKVGTEFFFGYGQVVQNRFNNIYNVDPFLATLTKYVEQDPLGLSALQAAVNPDVEKGFEKRFVDKLQIPIETYNTLVSYPPLNSREGDTILQGRFGAQIKFTSTLEDTTIHKNSSAVKVVGSDKLSGANGLASSDSDPLIILQASKIVPTTEKGFLNADLLDDNSVVDSDSSIYLTSTQSIPVEVACSRKLFSWNITLITNATSREVDLESAALSKFIPDKYDPNQVFNVNIAGTVGFPQPGPGPGGYSGGTAIVSSAGETSTTPSLWAEAQRYVGWKYQMKGKPKIVDGQLTTSLRDPAGNLALDCSGFVNAVLHGPGSRPVFNRSSETTVQAGKNFMEVQGGLTPQLLNKEGIAIGTDNGYYDHDAGRPLGVDHILMTILNPNTGQLEIWQSSGGKGTNGKSLADGIASINKRAKRIWISDYK